jgi:O-antigen ligase
MSQKAWQSDSSSHILHPNSPFPKPAILCYDGPAMHRGGRVSSPIPSRWLRPVLILGLHAVGLCALLAAAGLAWQQGSRASEGVWCGPPPDVSPSFHQALGINVELEQYDGAELATILDEVEAANLLWIRQRFPWADIQPQREGYSWTAWDRIVQSADAHGLKLIAVLDTSPSWARAFSDQANRFAPPHERAEYGAFVAAFAARYADEIDFYQIWDEPNIAPHWGSRPADPADYLGLLREGYVQVKAADPTAYVLLAGLAPTIEKGGANLDEVAYLDRLYRLGGEAWFDVAAGKPYGFDSAPDCSHTSPDQLNYGRLALLREVMERHGDSGTPLWAVEFGWNSLPASWEGSPSIWGQVDEVEQAEYTRGALECAGNDWPWLGLQLWSAYRPSAPVDDPHWGFALVRPSGTPRPVYLQLQEAASAPPLLLPGTYSPEDPALRYKGAWRITAEAADVGQTGDVVEFTFRGTQLDLDIQRGPCWAYLSATVDGQPANALPRDGSGQANLVLFDPLAGTERVTIARGLADGQHQARLAATGGWGQWAIRGFVVSRRCNRSLDWLLWGLAVLVVATIGSALRVALRPETAEAWRTLLLHLELLAQRFRQLNERLQWAAVLSVALLLVLSRWPALDVACLIVLALLLFVRLDLVLPLIAFAIPFCQQPKAIGGHQIAYVEIFTLLGALVSAVSLPTRRAFPTPADVQPSHHHKALLRTCCARLSLASLDWPVLALTAAAALSLITAGNWGVALREFRVVIVESALFYALISRMRRGAARSSPWPLVDGLVLGALAVSLIALSQLATGQGRVAVEGVWRVRALYGSPNNLGLYLGRILPLLVAVAAYGRNRARRWAYALLLVPSGLACVFTFSKGALLLGLPAAVLFLGLAGAVRTKGRRRWRPLLVAVAFLLVWGAILTPLFFTERFAGLLDFSRGTSFIRLQLWRGALNMGMDHPWLGVGPDNFLYEYRTRYVVPSAWEELNLSHPHNIVLDFWTRIGLVGLAAGVWLMVVSLRLGWRLALGEVDRDRQALLLGLVAGIVASVAHGLIDNAFFLVDLAFVFMLAAGVFRRTAAETV